MGLQVSVDDQKGEVMMKVDGVVWPCSWTGQRAAGWLGSSKVEVQGKNIHARVASVARCVLAEHWPVTCLCEGPSVNVISIAHNSTLHTQEATSMH
jgi:hypothetical protein